eukprot:2007997-Rhodomonas_salina.2
MAGTEVGDAATRYDRRQRARARRPRGRRGAGRRARRARRSSGLSLSARSLPLPSQVSRVRVLNTSSHVHSVGALVRALCHVECERARYVSQITKCSRVLASVLGASEYLSAKCQCSCAQVSCWLSTLACRAQWIREDEDADEEERDKDICDVELAAGWRALGDATREGWRERGWEREGWRERRLERDRVVGERRGEEMLEVW